MGKAEYTEYTCPECDVLMALADKQSHSCCIKVNKVDKKIKEYLERASSIAAEKVDFEHCSSLDVQEMGIIEIAKMIQLEELNEETKTK